jgi:hypothetical protein
LQAGVSVAAPNSRAGFIVDPSWTSAMLAKSRTSRAMLPCRYIAEKGNAPGDRDMTVSTSCSGAALQRSNHSLAAVGTFEL